MGHLHARPATVRCVVCDRAGKEGAARWRRFGGWGQPVQHACPDHRDLRPSQWAGARAHLARLQHEAEQAQFRDLPLFQSPRPIDT